MARSYLKEETFNIAPGITLVNPTIGEILDDEQIYYGIASTLTSVPFQYMVQLDDMGIDYEKINEWQFFQMMFLSYCKQAEADENGYVKGIDLVFKDIELRGFETFHDNETNEDYLFNLNTGVKIDELCFKDITTILRKLNNFEHCKSKPGNEAAKKYLLEKERKKLRRQKRKGYEPYLERLVIGMVNMPEFKYNYEQTMDMRLYTFNQSFLQVQHKVTFDKTMIGVSIGFADTSKMKDKSILSWIKF